MGSVAPAMETAKSQDLHGADAKTRERALRRDTERTLVDLYDIRAQMEPSVQALLHPTVQDHLVQPIRVAWNWIAIHEPLVRESLRTAKTRAIKGMQSIRRYFESGDS